MSPPTPVALFHNPGFPRVSGDEPHRGLRDSFQPAFSPRERG